MDQTGQSRICFLRYTSKARWVSEDETITSNKAQVGKGKGKPVSPKVES
jgi:hypothetical protein